MNSSLVTKAKTALHSAAAKAEKVLTDIKADLKNDRGKEEKSASISRNKLENQVNTEKGLSKEDHLLEASISNLMIPSTCLKQLATAMENGNNFKSMKDIVAPTAEPSPTNEKLPFVPSISSVKSLVLRDKDEKKFPENSFGKVASYIQQLFDTGCVAKSEAAYGSLDQSMVYLPQEIHGAPPGTFVARLAEIMGSIKTPRKMALFWMGTIAELKNFWFEGQPIPLLPLDENPDLNLCLLHQQLQAVNCCIARKQRQLDAINSFHSAMENVCAKSDDPVLSPPHISPNAPALYAKDSNGDLVLRLGADHPSQNLSLLETGEPIYSPVTQEGPVFTEDVIRETEEFILRTGSVGAGCSQLLSDMQAFKAANPGCILEDFVRWHSPPDWIEGESSTSATGTCGREGTSSRGQLSRRMNKEGNLWRELWENARPIPAVKQAPIYDEDLAVEDIFNHLDEAAPVDIFQQLFVAALSAGFTIAEAAIPTDSEAAKLLTECKQYVISTYQSEPKSENIEHLCQVYAAVERLSAHPEEASSMRDKSDYMNNKEPKRPFEKFNLSFPGKSKLLFGKSSSVQDKQVSDVSQPRRFAQFFDSKSSLFRKKTVRTASASTAGEPLSPDDCEWTIV